MSSSIIPDEKHHLLIRSRTTRKLTNGNNLYQEVDSAPVAGGYTIELPTDNRKNQYKWQTLIELRFISCSLKCPENLIKKSYPSYSHQLHIGQRER